MAKLEKSELDIALERVTPQWLALKRKLVLWGIEMALLTNERGKGGSTLSVENRTRRHELMRLVRAENSSQKANESVSIN